MVKHQCWIAQKHKAAHIYIVGFAFCLHYHITKTHIAAIVFGIKYMVENVFVKVVILFRKSMTGGCYHCNNTSMSIVQSTFGR